PLLRAVADSPLSGAAMAEASASLNLSALLAIAAGLCGVGLAALSLVRRRPSPATWFFAFGMTTLALDSVLAAFTLRARTMGAVNWWLTAGMAVKALVPGVWLGFSLA